jgi:hypothetical protein
MSSKVSLDVFGEPPSVPTTLIFDGDGVLRKGYVGQIAKRFLETDLDAILGLLEADRFKYVASPAASLPFKK